MLFETGDLVSPADANPEGNIRPVGVVVGHTKQDYPLVVWGVSDKVTVVDTSLKVVRKTVYNSLLPSKNYEGIFKLTGTSVNSIYPLNYPWLTQQMELSRKVVIWLPDYKIESVNVALTAMKTFVLSLQRNRNAAILYGYEGKELKILVNSLYNKL